MPDISGAYNILYPCRYSWYESCHREIEKRFKNVEMGIVKRKEVIK